EGVPNVDGIADERRKLRRSEARCDVLVDKQLGEAIAADIDPRRREHANRVALATSDAEIERTAAKVEDECVAGGDLGGVRRRDRLQAGSHVAKTGQLRR